jgi:Zn finger protein HypA/HybF involved in hydrogenase expression
MHELSLAQSLLELAEKNVPPGSTLTRVHVLAGALRGVDRHAMTFAWRLVTERHHLSACLNLQILPWSMRCADCHRQWEAADMVMHCTCGSSNVFPSGSDELLMQSIECESSKDGALCKSQSSKMC